MRSSLSPAQQQQRRVQRHAERADAVTMFNLLTGPQLLERVDAALPEHRERLYPPTETLSMFVTQVLSADGSCQQAVDAAQVRRLIADCNQAVPTPAPIARHARVCRWT